MVQGFSQRQINCLKRTDLSRRNLWESWIARGFLSHTRGFEGWLERIVTCTTGSLQKIFQCSSSARQVEGSLQVMAWVAEGNVEVGREKGYWEWDQTQTSLHWVLLARKRGLYGESLDWIPYQSRGWVGLSRIYLEARQKHSRSEKKHAIRTWSR